jgi:hypothetical protein
MSSPSDKQRVPSHAVIFALFLGEVLLMLLMQLPGVADFQKFGFYDEGAWLHLDRLFADGARPTIDVGYSYGALPLLLTRAWCAAVGRTPWAFIGFVTVCNIGSAWGLARVFHATGTTWLRLAVACVLLPLAIMPNAYSLMHPLEMVLLIAALAQQARGRYGGALAFATLAVLTKPSMGYVLGLLLLVLAAWLRKGWRVVLPPAVAGAAAIGVAVGILGVRPAIANILPVTGGKSYQQMDFGIFHAGMSFWAHGGTLLGMVDYYFRTPALFWIAGSICLWVLGVLALMRLCIARPGAADAAAKPRVRPTDALVATIAIMHAAFVFAFYAWSGSWTYYSYLLVAGLVIGLRGTRSFRALMVFALLGIVGLNGRWNDAFSRWMGMVRSPEVGGLWIYPDVLEDAREVRELARKHKTLYMVNGALPTIWPEAQTPPSWFLSPGIPTEEELQKTNAQLAAADLVILCADYDTKQEAWSWPQFKAQREQFGEQPLLKNKHFEVYARKAPASQN